MQVDVDQKIVVLSRIKVLWRVVHEISEKIGASESLLETFRKGVLEYQIFSGIRFNLLSQQNKCVANFELKIDWDKHEVLASSEDGSRISVTKGKSVTEQVMSIATELATLIEDTRRMYPKSQLTAQIWFREEWTEPEEKFREALRLTGTVVRKQSASSKILGPTTELKFSPNKLSEFAITFRMATPAINEANKAA